MQARTATHLRTPLMRLSSRHMGPSHTMLHPVHAAPNSTSPANAPPVLLLDIMDTVVVDPFYTHMAPFFGLTFEQLLAAKHPTAWLQFERGEVDEDEFYIMFFKDGRNVDGQGLRDAMGDAYTFVPGMQVLLEELSSAGHQMHACSNYTSWYKVVEERLELSRYLQWTFVSCEGPMKGLRKPQPECFDVIAAHLQVPHTQLLLIDDRQANVDAAVARGMDGVVFRDTMQLRGELVKRGLVTE